jgi:hypothetical protein
MRYPSTDKTPLPISRTYRGVALRSNFGKSYVITQLPSDKCPAPRTRISRRLGAKSMQFQGWRTATPWQSVWFKSDAV